MREEKPPFVEIGQQYGRLTVIGLGPRVPNGLHHRSFVATWCCRCSCGSARNVRKGDLIKGIPSCGCISKERLIERATHRDSKSAEYRSWSQMIQRCTNAKLHSFRDYGGRGIRVCGQWLKYEQFLADMGRRPALSCSIERKNNNGNYEPGNCRWATPTEQANNRRSNVVIEWNGTSRTITEWSRYVGVSQPTLRDRIQRYGWSIERALTEPAGAQGRHKERSSAN